MVSLTRKKIIGGIVVGLAIFSLLVAMLAKAGNPDRVGRAGGPVYSGSGGAVAIIEINGIIMAGKSSAGFLGGGVTGSETVMAQLRQVSRSPDIKAIVLRINSPGGTPAASQEITDEIEKLKKSGVKVVSSMADVAASGAYWIASASDLIISNPGTITGSIGVLIQTSNYSNLFDKLGIDNNTIKSGAYKDMGSPDRPLTGEEREIFQSMVDDTYNQFVDTVAGNRKIKPEEIQQLNGRVLTGRQALKAGLVDQMGNYYEAVSMAGELAGLGKNPRTINITPGNQWWRFFDGAASDSGLANNNLADSIRSYFGALLIYPPSKLF